MKKKVLVFGATGLVGSYFSEVLSGEAFEIRQVSATQEDASRALFKCDINNPQEVTALFANFSPDIVVNFAALTNVDKCETEKEHCWQSNYLAVQHLVSLSEKHNAFLLHISTDFVYEGTKQEYRETDAPNPVSFYGWSKYASETLVLHSAVRSAIVRTSLVYGENPKNSNKSNILTWLVYSLRNKQPLTIINDQYRCPTFALDLAQGCLQIIATETEGVFHLCGKDRLSILNFAKKVIRTFELDEQYISEITSAELAQPAKRPKYTYLSIDKAQKALGYEPMSLDESLDLLKDLI